ncbi:hypothetical protein HXX76_005190 [Chlamydomonas incerta]|uniref:Uncharacterized protein n=1 Tax=Chlamydomonas incerta TaxID=51695 RepID=A0A835W613_CHLIN|nr:hypothetical protein HXX76_005190 [Chlamydomonas incerta]|eukprot:KAG2438643.1 hypothetical protein HXX76_005190 [Chlamydomonas incerta]
MRSFYGGSFVRRTVPVAPAEELELIPQRCSNCGGTGSCTCVDCGGRGRLGRAGYNKRNRVDMTRIVGSKWTAMQETMGWRHFRVIQCRKGSGAGMAFVQLQASCEPATQLWMNASNLKDRDLWAAGWLQKSQMEDPAGAAAAGVTCRACSGSGTTPCPVCDATGAVLRPPSGLSTPAAGPLSAAAAAAAERAQAEAEAEAEAGGPQAEERAAAPAGAAATGREAAGLAQGGMVERGGSGSRAGSVLGRGRAGGGRSGLPRGPSPGASAGRLAGVPASASAPASALPAGRLGASDMTSGV